MISDADIEKAARAIAAKERLSDWAMFANAARVALEAVGYHSWMPIDDDAKSADQIIACRADSGAFLARWIAPLDFLTEREVEEADLDLKDIEEPDWFYADFVQGGRVTDGVPTHYKPLDKLPELPESN